MIMQSTKRPAVDGIRKRAQKVRNNWSASERERRAGLPPDAPETIRSFILGATAAQWTMVRVGGG